MGRNRLVALSWAGMLGCAAMMVGALASGAQAQQTKQGKDIVETAMAAGSFETLVTAIKAAGLVEALKREGPFTVGYSRASLRGEELVSVRTAGFGTTV